MSMGLIVVLVVQAMALLVFAICALRWLFALRRDAVATSGTTFPGLGATLNAFREGLRDARYSGLRRGIAVSVAILLGAALLMPFLMQT